MLVSGPSVSMQRPPDDHCLTHFPKHRGCNACNNCKVQRKHCRDKEVANNKKHERTIKRSPTEVGDVKDTAPTDFGELITSDSIFVLRKESAPRARHGGTTALVARGRGTGWRWRTQRGTSQPRKQRVQCNIPKRQDKWNCGTPAVPPSFTLHAATKALDMTKLTPTYRRRTA